MINKQRWQARSQVCVSGMAELSWRNHQVQNLTGYFILYVITIKLVMWVQEEIELSSLSQRPKLSSTKISGDPSLAPKTKQQ